MFLTDLLLILHLASVFALVGGVALRWFGARSLTVAAVPEEVVWATGQVAGLELEDLDFEFSRRSKHRQFFHHLLV